MTDRIYKLVTYNSAKGEYRSLSKENSLRYRIGHWTFSVPYSPGILCFSSIKCCVDFWALCRNYISEKYIFECEYRGEPILVDNLLYESARRDMGSVYTCEEKGARRKILEYISGLKNQGRSEDTFLAPLGTISVDAVRPMANVGSVRDHVRSGPLSISLHDATHS